MFSDNHIWNKIDKVVGLVRLSEKAKTAILMLFIEQNVLVEINLVKICLETKLPRL